MDDKGFAFTPLAFLLIIPVIVLAASANEIADEINTLSQIAIGGDVTATAANNVILSIEKGAKDAGRNAAYNATRTVIDNEALRMSNPFFSQSSPNDSKTYIRQRIVDAVNNNTVATCLKLETETGRQIYVNNISIDSYTDKPFTINDINISQGDPFSFNVQVNGGIPITVVQNGQNQTFRTPPINVQVSIEGLEDPYIWVNTKDRRSAIIYRYPYYSSFGPEYHFADSYTATDLAHLTDCLNGTNNPTGITPRSYYFPDVYGLTFFDRLENKTNTSSSGPNNAKMSTFIMGEPLYEDYHGAHISALDHEYFAGASGTKSITITVGSPYIFRDPYQPSNNPSAANSIFYLSDFYFNTVFKLKTNYP